MSGVKSSRAVIVKQYTRAGQLAQSKWGPAKARYLAGRACQDGYSTALKHSRRHESSRVSWADKGLSVHAGQTHVHRFVEPLLARMQKGEIDPSFIISHTLPLEQAAEAYDMFREKQDGCIKVVLKP